MDRNVPKLTIDWSITGLSRNQPEIWRNHFTYHVVELSVKLSTNSKVFGFTETIEPHKDYNESIIIDSGLNWGHGYLIDLYLGCRGYVEGTTISEHCDQQQLAGISTGILHEPEPPPPPKTQNSYTLPLVLPASNAALTGFVRIINNSFQPGTVSITAIDDTGSRFGPITLNLNASETVNFNSRDLEQGNAAKGLSGGAGDGRGSWRLILDTALNITPLAYIRTTDGFVTSMHEVAPEAEADSRRYRVAFFNPGSNANQVSRLRLINPGTSPAEIEITGRDDAGDTAPGGSVSLSLPAGGARTLTAQALENGAADITGNLGQGTGKWQLTVSSNVAIDAVSLLQSPTGHLSNLSSSPEPGSVDALTLPLVLPASESALTGFVRIINRSGESGLVRVTAIDDTGRRFGPVTLNLESNETVNFNSRDLENGNASKGLSGGVGNGQGNWRLELETPLDIAPLAYIRTTDGFVTSMHDVVPTATGQQHQVPFFNPGSNMNQVSRLRLTNPGTNPADISITGRDDAGMMAPGGIVNLTLPAGESRSLTAQTLESGGEGITGNLGQGTGKWRLFVSNDRSIEVMSLLQSPTGHLANLSGIPYPITPLTFADAEPLTISNGEVRLSGQFDSLDDVDYYVMELDAPTDVQFPNIPGVVLIVFDSQGNVVARTVGSGGAPEGAAENPIAIQGGIVVGRLLVAAAPYIAGAVEGGAYAAAIYLGLKHIFDTAELEIIWGRDTELNLKDRYQGERSVIPKLSGDLTVRTRYGTINVSASAEETVRVSHIPAKDAPCGTGREASIKFPVSVKVSIPAANTEVDKETTLQLPIKITRERAPRRIGDEYAITVSVPANGDVGVNLNQYIEDPDGGTLTFELSRVPSGWNITPSDDGDITVAAGEDAKDGQATVTARDADGECWNFPLRLRVIQTEGWWCCDGTVNLITSEFSSCTCFPGELRSLFSSCSDTPFGDNTEEVGSCPSYDTCCLLPGSSCTCASANSPEVRNCTSRPGGKIVASCPLSGTGNSLNIREILNPSDPGANRRAGGDFETLLDQLSRSGSARESAGDSVFRVSGL